MVKVFTEEPIGLEALVPDADADARRRSVEAAPSLEAFLAGLDAPYARAYLAGTHLGPPRRVGLTALDDAEAWVRPLLSWAADRAWSAIEADGSGRGLLVAEAAAALRRADVLALAVGPAPLDALAEAAAVGASRRDRLPALRAVLDAGAAAFFPEPAFDGTDWSLFAPAPLRDPLVAAFRQHPAASARRLVAPYRRARGEHTFYFEQWALDALPDWVEEV
ncbi:hypothetical protein [Rubrivirga marina]|uniref:hypothetical protein n=1 Tax=Rubrivirga marina TaxID=1196024 RepID=UPI00117AED03|nr:hypothetical protein [Rubrivirga marina]